MNTTSETILFEEGMEHDLEEGWPKVTSRQQGGRPAKAFKELIQNALDSYPEEVPIKDRKGDIINGHRYIAIKDYGSGMSLDQISMLFTVGGTTKYGVNSLIGNFGIGFKQLFNERLGVTLVKVTTVCEQFAVELTFTVKDPKTVPDIDHTILDHDLDFGTMVEVFFNNDVSADECLEEAIQSLKYYPCRFTINGNESISEWDKARKMNAFFFSKTVSRVTSSRPCVIVSPGSPLSANMSTSRGTIFHISWLVPPNHMIPSQIMPIRIPRSFLVCMWL